MAAPVDLSIGCISVLSGTRKVAAYDFERYRKALRMAKVSGAIDLVTAGLQSGLRSIVTHSAAMSAPCVHTPMLAPGALPSSTCCHAH